MTGDRPLRAVLDANVLFPFTLRDTLLRAAAMGLFHARWSEQILDEATRNLVSSGRMTERQAEHLREAMKRSFPDAIIRGFESLIGNMPNDVKDRHVTAAAVASQAQVIVTQNLRDFAALPEGVTAVHPDTFLLALFNADADTMVALLRRQANALRNPPVEFHQLLAGLEVTIPRFVAAVRSHQR